MKVAILTISDRCARGEAEDLGGALLRDALRARGVEIIASSVVPDERDLIVAELVRFSDALGVDVVLTTGGTGLGPRDLTPEATESVLDRRVPGIPEAIRARSLPATPTAMLSRAAAGLRGRTLIVNLPGSPKGAQEGLEILWPVLGHALEMIAGAGHPAEARDDREETPHHCG